ncbi:MAG: hypothetical protein U1A77_08600 [Pirellulales bacterium]
MRWSIALAFVAAMVVGSQSKASGDEPSSGKQLQLNVSVFEGDPLGSVEAGTLKVSAEPCLVTHENRLFSFVSGGEIAVTDGEGVQFVPFGWMIAGKTGATKDGKVRLDITLTNTTVGQRNEGRTQLHTESTRTITTIRLGEVLKLRWGKSNADRQAWAVLSVEEVKP